MSELDYGLYKKSRSLPPFFLLTAKSMFIFLAPCAEFKDNCFMFYIDPMRSVQKNAVLAKWLLSSAVLCGDSMVNRAHLYCPG